MARKQRRVCYMEADLGQRIMRAANEIALVTKGCPCKVCVEDIAKRIREHILKG